MRFVQTYDELQATIKASPVLIIDYTASWCGPCKHIAPSFERHAAANPLVTMVKVDIDVNQEAADRAGVTGVPTFELWIAGEVKKKFSGADESQLAKMVQMAAAAAQPKN